MSGEAESLVVAKDLGKRYGDFIALHPLDVKVSAGEFFGVFDQMVQENPLSSNC